MTLTDNHFWTAAWHALVYIAFSGLLLIAAYWVLDLLTPGKLGERLADSRSAQLITVAWIIGNGLILYTSIGVNGAGGVAGALGWTLGFGLLGILANTVMILVVDLVTPGNLRSLLVQAGSIHGLAWVTAAFIIGISRIICISIS